MRSALLLTAVGLLTLAPRGAAQAPAAFAPERAPAAGLGAEAGAGMLAFWQALGDTTLARLTAEAFRANHDVAVAEARVRQARAARTGAALDFAPTVTTAAGYTRQRISGAAFGLAVPDRGLWDAELRAAWEIDVFGRIRRNVRAYGALTESSREDVRDVQRLIAAELATAYFELRGVEEQLAVAERNAENQRNTVQLTRDLLEAGRGTDFDVERARALLSSTLSSIPALEAQAAAVRHRIGVLVGRDPRAVGEELAGAGRLPALPAGLELGDTEALIRARPDVQAAERRLAAETAFVGAAKADYLPRLSIGGTAGFTATAFDSLGRSGSGRYAVGPVLTWPALNLGRVKASVDQARALESAAAARYEQTLLRAREDLATAVAVYEGARVRLDRLAEAAEASARAAELARIRFEGGITDFLQVLDAERSLLAAQDRLAAGRTDAATALVGVYRAVGGGLAGR